MDKKMSKAKAVPQEAVKLPAQNGKMPHKAWTGMLTFGLVSAPVILYTAAREEAIHFNQLHDDCHGRLKMGPMVCSACDKEVPRENIVKGYEVSKDNYIVITQDEIDAMKPESAKIMEIIQFVPAEQVDPIYFEQGYYLAPDDAGRRVFSILRAAIQQRNVVGVAKIVKSSREHLVLIRPYGVDGLMVHSCYFSDEVRPMVFPSLPEVKNEEVRMAAQLIDTLADDWNPAEFSDSYRDNLRGLIASRLEGKETRLPARKPAKAAVVDILSALSQSVDEAKGKRKQKKTA